jgi:hypothetical protein
MFHVKHDDVRERVLRSCVGGEHERDETYCRAASPGGWLQGSAATVADVDGPTWGAGRQPDVWAHRYTARHTRDGAHRPPRWSAERLLHVRYSPGPPAEPDCRHWGRHLPRRDSFGVVGAASSPCRSADPRKEASGTPPNVAKRWMGCGTSWVTRGWTMGCRVTDVSRDELGTASLELRQRTTCCHSRAGRERTALASRLGVGE